jgi:putative component of membrane protein insertase Oxa1/YidC/SpoIIIJ protein YidD
VRDASTVRALLSRGVAFYRRRLSGRGPLRRVRCTFEHTESCSAYGARVLRGSRSSAEAVARIARRLLRCRSLSLYAFPGGGLGWGDGFDALLGPAGASAGRRQLDRRLTRDAELPATRDAVAAACARVAEAVWLPPLAPQHGGPEGTGLLRRGGVGAARALALRARIATAVACLLCGVGLACAYAGFGAAALAAAAGSAVSAWRLMATRRALARLRWLSQLSRLTAVSGRDAAARCRQRRLDPRPLPLQAHGP